jgi:hypothetical protein
LPVASRLRLGNAFCDRNAPHYCVGRVTSRLPPRIGIRFGTWPHFGLAKAIWKAASLSSLARRLRTAKLKERGVIEDINYQHPRQLDRKLMRSLVTSEWVRQHHNIFIGPTGIGKSWLSCALAHKAWRDGFTVLHKRTSELFRDLAVAHADSSSWAYTAEALAHRHSAVGRLCDCAV